MFIPCPDSAYHQDINQDSTSYIVVYHSNQQQSAQDVDFCSALCSCHCCQSHITFSYSEDISSELVAGATFNNLDATAISEHSYSIWQPPKA